jgi:formylglycine-generating enzyme required for sulfatase activity
MERAELKRLLEADPKSQDYAGALSAETPQHEAHVPGFFLQVNEVTNEQYAVFVRATGRRPPFHWGAASIARGRDEYLAELEAQKEEALASSRPVPDAVPFDEQAWWSANWPGKPASIPPGDELRPVVFVDWDDARAYARWAGLRLPTEHEYQRAVRGDSDRRYPWGDEWDSERYAATSLLRKRSGAWPVGSFAAGASKQGVFDLAGNVWEWTASEYVPFAGYEVETFEFGFGTKLRRVDAVADWTPGKRVVVGGSFQNGNLMARATTRRATDPAQVSDALGFRCAASTLPGLDVVQALFDDELTVNARPREDGSTVEFALDAVVAAERWEQAPVLSSSAPAGYATIAAHHCVAFTPVKQLPVNDFVGFERLTHERFAEAGRPMTLGFFTTNVPIVEPALEPGTWFVGYRARGRKGDLGARAAAVEEKLALDPAADWLVFSRLDGTPALAVRQRLEWGSTRASRAVFVEPEAAPRTDGAPSDERLLRLELTLPTRTRGKGIVLPLVLRAAPGVFAGEWRMTR